MDILNDKTILSFVFKMQFCPSSIIFSSECNCKIVFIAPL